MVLLKVDLPASGFRRNDDVANDEHVSVTRTRHGVQMARNRNVRELLCLDARLDFHVFFWSKPKFRTGSFKDAPLPARFGLQLRG